jgi:hypothetical protein
MATSAQTSMTEYLRSTFDPAIGYASTALKFKRPPSI